MSEYDASESILQLRRIMSLRGSDNDLSQAFGKNYRPISIIIPRAKTVKVRSSEIADKSLDFSKEFDDSREKLLASQPNYDNSHKVNDSYRNREKTLKLISSNPL